MSRWKASGLYLLASAVVATCVLAFMLLVWFPWPLFEVAGGGNLALILTSVDVVLGPLLVLIVYKQGKRTLRFDLTVIALLQLAALAYGIYTISLARPVYMIFAVDRFEVITAKDLDPEDLRKASRPEFRSRPWGRPRYIGVDPPKDSATATKILMSSFQGKDVSSYPQYYVPYASLIDNARGRAKPIDSVRARAPELIDRYLRESGRSPDSVRFLPLTARKKDAAVLMDAASGEPLKIIVVDPW